jgi:hypothetical protein
MDIWEWIIISIITLFTLFGLPYPYAKIGKKVKKGYTWSRGLATIVYDRFYTKPSIVENFFYFVEEFENFIMPNYTPSFPHMYRELVGKATFTNIEERYIDEQNEKVNKKYLEIKNVEKVERKRVFARTVREFKDLVIDVSKIAQTIKSTIRDQNLGQPSVVQTSFARESTNWIEYARRYKFSANEFNNFLRYFRSFLDKTSCSHGVEIEQNRLMQLLVPEDLID